MTETVHLGQNPGTSPLETDEAADLEIFHTLFSGQTNLSGKTTTIKTLLPRVVEAGYTVLVFDTKPTIREFEGYNDIPLCYKPTTDALVLIGLLESVRRSRLSPYYATLSRLTEGAKNLGDIVENAEDMERTSHSGFIKDAAHTLADLIRRLQVELGGLYLSSGLNLKSGKVNVMALNGLSVETQQLIVKSSFEAALKHRRLILVLDEGWRFLPEQYSSACKRAIQDVVTQGAKTKLFFWMATQFLAPTDKDALKAMANKLVGRQDHITEVKHSQDLIPNGRSEWPSATIMKLKRGEFIFVPMEGETRKIYVDNPVLDEPKQVHISRIPKMTYGRSSLEAQTALQKLIEATKPAIMDVVIPADEIAPTREPFGKSVLEHGGVTESGQGKALAQAAPVVVGSNPTPSTKTLAAFTLQVTRLESDSFIGKVVYILKKLGHRAQKKEILDAAEQYGWLLDANNHFGRDIANYVKNGVVLRDGAGWYRLPSEVKVEEVPA